MRLNAAETALMNNPLRAAIQKRFEAKRLLAMGGRLRGGRALEVGCGRGVGVELILEGLSPAWPTELGEYLQEWEVTFSDGGILTFPSGGHNTIKIIEDLNS